MKDTNDKKLESLETKLIELTNEISSLKKEGNQEIKDSLQVQFKIILYLTTFLHEKASSD